jgi:hypothetical protein
VRFTGHVVDENGVPVDGAQVFVQVEGAGQAETFTDVNGNFAITSLTQGKAHLRVLKPGFFEISDRPIDLESEENEISLVLNHETEIKEQVEVRSYAAQIDPDRTAHQETLVQHEILDTPIANSHDLNKSLTTMPGVVEDTNSQLHVAGARADETEVVLDGFEINDPATNTFDSRINVDSVRQATVQSGRYGAEYAHAGAGILDLDTTVGDDRFRYGVTNFIPGVSAQQGLHLGNWYPRVTFSGPIKHGRAWFSNASTLEHDFKLLSDLPRGANITQRWAGDNLLRGQVNLTPHNLLQGSFLYNGWDSTHVGLGPLTPLSTTREQRNHRFFVSAKDQVWVGRTLLELGVAIDTGSNRLIPQGTLPYVITTTTASGNYFEAVTQHSRRLQFIGNVLAGSRHWHGAHDLSAGINVAGLGLNQQAARTQIDTERSDGTLANRTTFAGPASTRLTNTQVGAYVQDAWHPGKRFVITAALRMDEDRLTTAAVVGPRAAVNFLPFANDRTKITVSWGRFYQPLDLSLFEMGSDQRRLDVFYDATGTIVTSGPAISRFVVPAGLRQPFFDTTSAGWEQRVRKSTLLGFNLISREGRNGLAYQNLNPGLSGGVYQLENGRHDRYRAAEAWARHAFTDQAEVFFDYTRSSATSNQALDPMLGALFFVAQAAGPVAWDAPNRFVSRGATPVPLWHLFVSYFAEYRTGFPFNVVNTYQQLVGAPGGLRYPADFDLNLGGEKRFRFHGHEWGIRVSAINLTGHDNPDSVVNNVDAPDFREFSGGTRRAFTGRLRLVK